MQPWQLPEYIADILPSTARRLENAKEALLSLFRVHGYELVCPPLTEYTDSLLARTDEGLSLKTIRITDQLSGRQLGLRADITPQVARIDAHLLGANNGVNRLCYAGTVLHAKPDGFFSTREPLQTGAELYGFDGIEADIEVIGLMLESLALLHIDTPKLALGHAGIFLSLTAAAGLPSETTASLFQAMRDKDTAAAAALAAVHVNDTGLRQAFAVLPELYGNRDTLERARRLLPALPAVDTALTQLQTVADAFPAHCAFIDLSELRSDAYHTGLLFAAYGADSPDALARGGRYNGLGRHFGRNRPATGFSFDLRSLTGKLPEQAGNAAVSVSAADAPAAAAAIRALRADGIPVVIDYTPGETGSVCCTARLVFENGSWQTIPF